MFSTKGTLCQFETNESAIANTDTEICYVRTVLKATLIVFWGPGSVHITWFRPSWSSGCSFYYGDLPIKCSFINIQSLTNYQLLKFTEFLSIVKDELRLCGYKRAYTRGAHWYTARSSFVGFQVKNTCFLDKSPSKVTICHWAVINEPFRGQNLFK